MLLRTLFAAAPGSDLPVEDALEDVAALVDRVDTLAALRERLAVEPFDLVILDLSLAPDAAQPLVRDCRERPDSPEVIVLIGELETPQRRAELVAAGAYAVLLRDLDRDLFRQALATLVERRLQESRAALQTIPDEDYRLTDYVTRSAAMKRVLRAAQRVATLDTTVLILGETGVGKGLLARSLHNESERAGGPFIAVNCGAITESILEAELFGHERGAFTGADRARRGYFELAHRGTLFLDEIAEMPLQMQVKLLQVLEDRTVRPVGSEKWIPVDVRLIAATNRDLPEEVKARRFREDLFYRLNVVVVHLPALRERREDLTEIAESYIEHFRAQIATPARRFSKQALAAIQQYPWPGNVRELANAVERAVIMATGEEIRVEDLAVDIQTVGPHTIADPEGARGAIEPDASWLERPWTDVRRQVLEEAEIRYLRGLLAETHGRVGESAKRAGMDPRSLHQKMKRYGLQKEDFRG